MPNVFKFNTSKDDKSLRKGNLSIGVGDVSKGWNRDLTSEEISINYRAQKWRFS
jgi:hypothetical protein